MTYLAQIVNPNSISVYTFVNAALEWRLPSGAKFIVWIYERSEIVVAMVVMLGPSSFDPYLISSPPLRALSD